MNRIENLLDDLRKNPRTWLITGVAGFIGSNLLEFLLLHGQKVIGLDNFATGYKHNIDQALSEAKNACNFNGNLLGDFDFVEGDIRDLQTCITTAKSVDYILHHAALGSVPRSIEDPLKTNDVNINGFLNMLIAARDQNVRRFVYAASSSTYGDHPVLPKVESKIGKPLSPYAVTKYVNELYAEIFFKTYDLNSIGLRYFNIFGKRQDPNGAYAAVIPKWIGSILNNQEIFINGDGSTSRDFCYIDNAIQMNILAATVENPASINQVYNVAVGDQTSLNELFDLIQVQINKNISVKSSIKPKYRDFRVGDVKHSLADISKAKNLLSYQPSHKIKNGILTTIDWYIKNLK